MRPVLHAGAGALLLFAAASAIPQQAVPPPPRPPDSGPSLEATMQYIQQKLSAIGTVTWIAPWQNTQDGSSGMDRFTYEFSQVTADAGMCKISYHLKWTHNGQAIYNEDYSFSLKNARDVVVEPDELAESRNNARLGHPELVEPAGTENPPIMALTVRLLNGEDKYFPFLDFFPFLEASDADRTAKAITHAIELCGGGGKELF